MLFYIDVLWRRSEQKQFLTFTCTKAGTDVAFFTKFLLSTSREPSDQPLRRPAEFLLFFFFFFSELNRELNFLFVTSWRADKSYGDRLW